MTEPLTRLARRLAAAQDEVLAEQDRANPPPLVPTLTVPRRRMRRLSASQKALVAGVLAAAAAALLLWWPATSTAPLSFVVSPTALAPKSGQDQRFFSAPDDTRMSLTFSDGSHVEVAPGADLRMTSLDADGAHLNLERGRVSLAVHHTDRTRWTIEAGPFTTRVVGTRFEVQWEPHTRAFRLVVVEGAVALTGPVVGEARMVRGGETLSVALPEQRAQLELGPAPTVTAPSIDVRALEEAAGGTLSTENSGSGLRKQASLRTHGARARGPSASEPASPTQAEQPTLAERIEADSHAGRFSDAVRLAVDEGWEDTLADLPPHTLFLLADAARLCQQRARAEQAYTQLRARFGGSSEAPRAAFALGRLAHKEGDFQVAGRWFGAYLREAPHGALAVEAMGRLLETQIAAQDRTAARATAAQYEREYPHGPHARVARSVLERSP